MGNHTKQMQRVRVIGIGLQDLLINILSLGQVTCRVVLNSKVQGLLESERLLLGGAYLHSLRTLSFFLGFIH